MMGLFSLEKLFGITIRESATDGSDFTNPDADYRRLFLGEDGALHLKDSAGAVTDIGGGGSVATDAIWDAAGDLAVGSGANTAAALTKGSDNDVLTISASTHVPVWAAPAGGYPTFSGARVYHSTTQTVSNSITPLNMDSEDFDTDTYHDNSTNNTRLTVPATGYYLVTGHAQLTYSGVAILGLSVNGTSVRGSAVSGSDSGSAKYTVTQIVYMTSGQYVELWAYQAGSANVGDVTYAENQNSLSIVRLA
jgi:hypothetical protein